jgi:hypothetical protein
VTFWAKARRKPFFLKVGKAIEALAIDGSLERMFSLRYTVSEKREKKGSVDGESDHDEKRELELSS